MKACYKRFTSEIIWKHSKFHRKAVTTQLWSTSPAFANAVPSVHLTYLGQWAISHSPSMPCTFLLSCLYMPVFFVPRIASPASSSKPIMKLSSSSPARKYPPSLLPKHSLHPTCWNTSFFLLVISHCVEILYSHVCELLQVHSPILLENIPSANQRTTHRRTSFFVVCQFQAGKTRPMTQ